MEKEFQAKGKWHVPGKKVIPDTISAGSLEELREKIQRKREYFFDKWKYTLELEDTYTEITKEVKSWEN